MRRKCPVSKTEEIKWDLSNTILNMAKHAAGKPTTRGSENPYISEAEKILRKRKESEAREAEKHCCDIQKK
jgi:hypothetical protein